MKSILLVEDDEFFRSALKKLLLSKNYEVVEAPNGKVAQEFLTVREFNLVLSDIQMPHMTGVELLEWVRNYRKSTLVILMTGFSHVLETQKAHELGAYDFIPKPFNDQDLLDKVAAAFGEKTVAPVEKERVDLDPQFCKLPIEDFIAEKETDCGVFIRISQFKYIKIAHKGGKLPEDKIKLFKDKGVTHFFVHQEDFCRLVGFTINLSKAVTASANLEQGKKRRFVQYTAEMIMQQAFVAGTDENLFRNTKDFLTASLDVLTQDDETFFLLDSLSQHSDFLYAHSVGVSMFSVMIAKNMGWSSQQTLFKLSFAGLFHDIGKKEIPMEVLKKTRALLSQQERALLESHTTRGLEILESLKNAPSEVVRVAYEHHEDVLGQGYPQGLVHDKTHPFSLIVGTANAFCEYTIRSPQNPTPRTASAAVQALQVNKIAYLDPQVFEALKKVVVAQKESA